MMITAPAEAAGARLDKWLADAGTGMSRSRLRVLIEEGRVTANGQPATDASAKVITGAVYAIDLPIPVGALPEPEDIPLDIVFEDKHLIIIDKPPGLVVHPAGGSERGTLVNALLFHCGAGLTGIGGVARPGIVHRLDKDTSGVMVAAKSEAAHTALTNMFAAHDIDACLSRRHARRAASAHRPHRDEHRPLAQRPEEDGGHEGQALPR
jgi:23S rRNA pseudouridine1911/1915/1917 synthase